MKKKRNFLFVPDSFVLLGSNLSIQRHRMHQQEVEWNHHHQFLRQLDTNLKS